MFAKLKKFLFSNTSTSQILAKNTFWLGFGEITSRLLKLIIIFYAIRILSVSDWGIFSYAISLCGLFMVFSDMGLSSILTRELSKNYTDKNQYISTSFLIKIILNIIIFSLIIIIAPLLSSNSKEVVAIIPIVGLLMVFDSIRDFIFSINRSLEKMETEAFIKITANILLIIFTYLFLLKDRTVYSLATGYMLGNFLGLIFTLIIFRKHLKNTFSHFSKKLIKPLIIVAWPFAFFAILGSIMSSTDTVMLGWIKGVKEVGFYSTSQKIIAFLYILPGLITSSLLPTLTKQISDKNTIKNIAQKVFKILNLFSIPMVIGGIILGENLILQLFGQEYAPSIVMFKISIVSILFVFPSLIFNSIIFIFNKHKSVIKISLIGTILNIIINIILIPKYGGIGAAIATLFSQIIIMILMKKEFSKIIDANIHSGLGKIFLGSILMGLFLIFAKYFIHLNLYISIIISVILYFFILIKLKEESLFQVKNMLTKTN